MADVDIDKFIKLLTRSESLPAHISRDSLLFRELEKISAKSHNSAGHSLAKHLFTAIESLSDITSAEVYQHNYIDRLLEPVRDQQVDEKEKDAGQKASAVPSTREQIKLHPFLDSDITLTEPFLKESLVAAEKERKKLLATLVRTKKALEKSADMADPSGGMDTDTAPCAGTGGEKKSATKKERSATASSCGEMGTKASSASPCTDGGEKPSTEATATTKQPPPSNGAKKVINAADGSQLKKMPHPQKASPPKKDAADCSPKGFTWFKTLDDKAHLLKMLLTSRAFIETMLKAARRPNRQDKIIAIRVLNITLEELTAATIGSQQSSPPAQPMQLIRRSRSIPPPTSAMISSFFNVKKELSSSLTTLLATYSEEANIQGVSLLLNLPLDFVFYTNHSKIIDEVLTKAQVFTFIPFASIDKKCTIEFVTLDPERAHFEKQVFELTAAHALIPSQSCSDDCNHDFPHLYAQGCLVPLQHIANLQRIGENFARLLLPKMVTVPIPFLENELCKLAIKSTFSQDACDFTLHALDKAPAPCHTELASHINFARIGACTVWGSLLAGTAATAPKSLGLTASSSCKPCKTVTDKAKATITQATRLHDSAIIASLLAESQLAELPATVLRKNIAIFEPILQQINDTLKWVIAASEKPEEYSQDTFAFCIGVSTDPKDIERYKSLAENLAQLEPLIEEVSHEHSSLKGLLVEILKMTNSIFSTSKERNKIALIYRLVERGAITDLATLLFSMTKAIQANLKIIQLLETKASSPDESDWWQNKFNSECSPLKSHLKTFYGKFWLCLLGGTKGFFPEVLKVCFNEEAHVDSHEYPFPNEERHFILKEQDSPTKLGEPNASSFWSFNAVAGKIKKPNFRVTFYKTPPPLAVAEEEEEPILPTYDLQWEMKIFFKEGFVEFLTATFDKDLTGKLPLEVLPLLSLGRFEVIAEWHTKIIKDRSLLKSNDLLEESFNNLKTLTAFRHLLEQPDYTATIAAASESIALSIEEESRLLAIRRDLLQQASPCLTPPPLQASIARTLEPNEIYPVAKSLLTEFVPVLEQEVATYPGLQAMHLQSAPETIITRQEVLMLIQEALSLLKMDSDHDDTQADCKSCEIIATQKPNLKRMAIEELMLFLTTLVSNHKAILILASAEGNLLARTTNMFDTFLKQQLAVHANSLFFTDHCKIKIRNSGISALTVADFSCRINMYLAILSIANPSLFKQGFNAFENLLKSFYPNSQRFFSQKCPLAFMPSIAEEKLFLVELMRLSETAINSHLVRLSRQSLLPPVGIVNHRKLIARNFRKFRSGLESLTEIHNYKALVARNSCLRLLIKSATTTEESISMPALQLLAGHMLEQTPLPVYSFPEQAQSIESLTNNLLSKIRILKAFDHSFAKRFNEPYFIWLLRQCNNLAITLANTTTTSRIHTSLAKLIRSLNNAIKFFPEDEGLLDKLLAAEELDVETHRKEYTIDHISMALETHQTLLFNELPEMMGAAFSHNDEPRARVSKSLKKPYFLYM